MALRVRFTIRALVQIDELRDWIKAQAPTRADSYIRELEAAIRHLAESPFPNALARPRPDLGRSLASFNFPKVKGKNQRTVVVEVTTEAVWVIQILGGAMDQPPT